MKVSRCAYYLPKLIQEEFSLVQLIDTKLLTCSMILTTYVSDETMKQSIGFMVHFCRKKHRTRTRSLISLGHAMRFRLLGGWTVKHSKLNGLIV